MDNQETSKTNPEICLDSSMVPIDKQKEMSKQVFDWFIKPEILKRQKEGKFQYLLGQLLLKLFLQSKVMRLESIKKLK